MDDLISRKAAIEALDKRFDSIPMEQTVEILQLRRDLRELPPAQPEKRTEERTETHGVCLDVIDRQAALDWLKNEWNGMVTSLFDGIKALPSAQPEPCVDTIDALDESIKHFDDMAEECRRNANIEQNDYMDMRDDAAEYRQLSIWLNELKWLRERFQSQPDLSEYSDKLWKAAYERGKAEAQQRWIPCSERLPEANGRYLVTRGLNACGSLWNRIYIANYSDLMGIKSVKIWWQGNVGKSDFERLADVLAWMPLPEPYAERKTDEKKNI